MMSHKLLGNGVALLGLFVVVFGVSRCAAEDAKQTTGEKKAKNVILFVGDGMGFNCDAAGTYFRFGENQAQRYHKFRQLACSTYATNVADFDAKKEIGYDSDLFWSDLNAARKSINPRACVTDSAASATSLNSGIKTENGRIGTDFSGKPVQLFADLAAEAKKGVGAITTVPLSHATPAAVMAHQFTRGQYREIFREQILDQPSLTVLMGAGHPDYENGKRLADDAKKIYDIVGGEMFWKTLNSPGVLDVLNVELIENVSDFGRIAAGLPDTGAKMPTRLLGVGRSTASIPPRDGVAEGEPDREEFADVPTLAEMTLGALNVLSKNENGFYLMVEGGAIDFANHSQNIEDSVREHTGFSRAIDAACDWIERYGSWDDTLVIITADHETGQLWGPDTFVDTNGNKRFDDGEEFHGFKPVENCGKGKIPAAQYAFGNHSIALVPLWVHGCGAESVETFIRGKDPKAAKFYRAYGYPFEGEYIDNTDVFRLMKAATGL